MYSEKAAKFGAIVFNVLTLKYVLKVTSKPSGRLHKILWPPQKT